MTATISSNLVALYVNGALVGSSSITVSMTLIAPLTNAIIGTSDTHSPSANGYFRDFRVYDSSLR